jgi:hypothetical protein
MNRTRACIEIKQLDSQIIRERARDLSAVNLLTIACIGGRYLVGAVWHVS